MSEVLQLKYLMARARLYCIKGAVLKMSGVGTGLFSVESAKVGMAVDEC